MSSRQVNVFVIALILALQPQLGLAKKKAKAPEVKSYGAHTLAREQWPPAIAPDFLRIGDKGYAWLGEQGGRLATVDLKREQGPQVLGELSGLGKKIVDIASGQHQTYVLVAKENADGDNQYFVMAVSATPTGDLTLLSNTQVSYLAEPTAIASGGEVLAIGGATSPGRNQVILLDGSGKRRSDEGNGPIATLNVDQPVSALAIQDRQLVVLEGAPSGSIIDVFNLGTLRSPQKVGSFKLDGSYHKLSRAKDMVAVVGVGADRKPDVRVLAFKPAPHMVSRARLPVSDVLDMVAQRTQLLVLGNQGSRLVVLPVAVGKDLQLSAGQAVVLPAGARGIAGRARIAANEKEAYIASDAGTLQVIAIKNGGWEYSYSHTIPRLPVATVAFSFPTAVVAGADIKVYDVSAPERPALVGTAEPGSAVRSVSVVGDLMLTLTRDGLSLRQLTKPSSVVASIKVDGQKLAYDPVEHVAYVIAAKEKETTITPVHVSKTLEPDAPQKIAGIFNDASAFGGRVLLSGLNGLAVFDAKSNAKVAERVFPNLAIRDVFMTGPETAVITAVDPSSKGFLLTINAGGADLPTIGSVDLPQDAVAVSVDGARAVVVGRNADGTDEATIVDLTNVAAPKLGSTFKVLESASAVAIKGKLGLVGGRGLEILNL